MKRGKRKHLSFFCLSINWIIFRFDSSCNSQFQIGTLLVGLCSLRSSRRSLRAAKLSSSHGFFPSPSHIPPLVPSSHMNHTAQDNRQEASRTEQTEKKLRYVLCRTQLELDRSEIRTHRRSSDIPDRRSDISSTGRLLTRGHCRCSLPPPYPLPVSFSSVRTNVLVEVPRDISL